MCAGHIIYNDSKTYNILGIRGKRYSHDLITQTGKQRGKKTNNNLKLLTWSIKIFLSV
jgi:hypothetical protein